MAAVIESWFRQDLQKPVQVHYLDGSLFSNNGNGNRIGVELTNGGEDYTVTGTVSGYAVLADGTTVPCTGSKSGNKASILVPPAAYLPGNIFITIFLTDGTTVTTLAAVSTTVVQARTDNQVSPGSVVTDWTNTINAAMQSVETAAANLGQIVATPYAQLTFPVPLGKYTYYNNNLYRCTTPIPSSEDFTAAHWSSALNLGDELSDVKSAMSANGLAMIMFNHGAYINLRNDTADPFSPVSSNEWKYAVVNCSEGDIFYVTGSGGSTPRLYAFVDSSNQIIEKAGENRNYNNVQLIAPANSMYLIINDKSDSNSYIGKPLFTTGKYEKNGSLKYNLSVTNHRTYNFENAKYDGIILENAVIGTTGAGAVSKNDNTLLTKEYLPDGFCIIPNGEYSIAVAKYDSNGTFISRTSFETNCLWMEPGYKYRLMMQRINGGNINESEIYNIVISPKYSDEISFNNGYMSTTGSIVYYSSTILCSMSFVPEKIKTIGLKNRSYHYFIARYNKSTGAFVDRSSSIQKQTTLDHSTYRYLILIEKQDQSTILPDESSALYLSENEYDVSFIAGHYGNDGSVAYINHGCVTAGYISSDILGVQQKTAKHKLSVVMFNKSTNAFIGRTAYETSPYFLFDHESYKYKVQAITEDESAFNPSDAQDQIAFIKDYYGVKPFDRSFGISDMSKYLSGDGTQVVIDEETGMVYVLYNAGTQNYGEAYTHYDLAVFPIHQPFMVKYYNVYTAGETYGELLFNGGQDSNISLGEGYVRIMVYETTTECWWYRDWNIQSKTFSNPEKITISFDTSTYVDFTKTNAKGFYEEQSLTWGGNPTIASRIFKKNDELYACLMPTAVYDPNYGRAVFIKSTNNGASWVYVNIIDIPAQIECAFAYLDSKWYIVARGGELWYSTDDFATVTKIGSVSCGGTRPDMFILDDEIVVCVSKAQAMWSSGVHNSNRTNVIMWKGKGTNPEDYKLMDLLQNPHGCTYYRIMNYKGVLYYIGTCGELYPDKHYADPQCKDGVYYIKLGFPCDMQIGQRYSIS